jgi:hypothetical protein
MHRVSESEGLEVVHPEYGLEPRVYYRNLYRYEKSFVAGSVALEDTDECAEGAQVTLTNDSGQVIGKAMTNNYGDFKIDGLENDGKYSLEIEYAGYKNRGLRVSLEDSKNVGVIFL